MLIKLLAGIQSKIFVISLKIIEIFQTLCWGGDGGEDTDGSCKKFGIFQQLVRNLYIYNGAFKYEK